MQGKGGGRGAYRGRWEDQEHTGEGGRIRSIQGKVRRVRNIQGMATLV